MFEKVGTGNDAEGAVPGREDELGCLLVSRRRKVNF